MKTPKQYVGVFVLPMYKKCVLMPKPRAVHHDFSGFCDAAVCVGMFVFCVRVCRGVFIRSVSHSQNITVVKYLL